MSLTKSPRETTVKGGIALPHGFCVSVIVSSALMLWDGDEVAGVREKRLVPHDDQETGMESVHTGGLWPSLRL